jgi:hypothetical protein
MRNRLLQAAICLASCAMPTHIFAAVSASHCGPWSGSPRTVREAKLVVRNKTGHDLASAAVVHRFGPNIFFDFKKWDAIADGKTSAPKTIRFQTGAPVIERDWWIVIWGFHEDDEDQIFVSDPHNFQDTVDVAKAALANAAATYTQSQINTLLTTAASATGASLIGPVISGLLTTIKSNPMLVTSYAGFKEYELTCGDVGEIVTVQIEPSEVFIVSPTGHESTAFKSVTTDLKSVYEEMKKRSAPELNTTKAKDKDNSTTAAADPKKSDANDKGDKEKKK